MSVVLVAAGGSEPAASLKRQCDKDSSKEGTHLGKKSRLMPGTSAKYIRVSGAATHQLNGLYALRRVRNRVLDCFGVPRDDQVSSPPSYEYVKSEGNYEGDGGSYRIFWSTTRKWWIGKMKSGYLAFETRHADAGRAHSAVDLDGLDPVRATAWREFTKKGWQAVDLVLEEVKVDDISVTVVSVAGEDLLRKSFPMTQRAEDVRRALRDAGSLENKQLEMQLSFDGHVLRRRAPLGGLPCHGDLTLQAILLPKGRCADCRDIVPVKRLLQCSSCTNLVCNDCVLDCEDGLFRCGVCSTDCLPQRGVDVDSADDTDDSADDGDDSAENIE
eukprot:TRINITY_DN122726_c0_g1_i1.p1 TRINITY_DN122726_c0_g1~~TRINITY_DN122726_c0_g1_i1.p1  ORF type:complete len:329 (-),score=37.87 TRINITY_DN122726_c0_g1_i1:16-1002(-)